MKTFYTIIICLLTSMGIVQAQQDTTNTVRNNVPDFERWTEEQILQWEDSVKNALYPEAVIESIPVPQGKDSKIALHPTASPMSFTNNHVNDSYPIDLTKDVGEIPMLSSVTPSGAVTYNVPIQISPGRQGFQPQLAVAYNSLAGNGVMGAGWNIAGLSNISRVGKSIYYDGKSEGLNLGKTDALVLDGTRLIKLNETPSQIDYQTEQGLIKVKAIVSGDLIRYFEVSYPNGNTAVFGHIDNEDTYYLNYPITSFTDLKGNTIHYKYLYSNYRYILNSITYGDASATFHYRTSRPDPITTYNTGRKIIEDRLLERVECKSDDITFRTYEFAYQTQWNTSVLTQIGCIASGKSLNPLRFLYGEGNTATSYIKGETQLLEWYTGVEPGQLKVSKGKFDYGTDNDGIITLPNKNPYWQHYRSSPSQNRYENQYTGAEKIFLYAGLNDDFASPMPNLTTEAGFVDILSANIDGMYEEEVIKVNNTVSGSYDRLQFKVYTANLYTGLALKYTRTFNFSTVLTDVSGGKSIHPKFYFSGDFNGDGKMEILAVSNHHPFGWIDKASRCYLFDLESNVKLYEGHAFAYNVEFMGTQQNNGEAAAQNTDRLFAFDYDGDGKTDICLINDTWTYIYTFDISGSSYTLRQVAVYTSLNKADLAGRNLMIGEFNGDGKPDLLLSPKMNHADWFIYYGKGDGQFEKTSVELTDRTSSDSYLLQDVNGDGLTDFIIYNANIFYTNKAKPGGFDYDSYTSFVYSGPVFVPTNINSRNYFHQLIALKDGKVTRFSYPRNDAKEKLLTGAVNSLGVVHKNHYRMLNETDYYYTKGYGAVYPYENFHGPFIVPVGTERYVNGMRNEYMEYRYDNAVIHKQGRGFCGFGKIMTYDNIRGRSYTQEFDPYNFSILKSDESPTAKNTYTYSVSVESNKIAKVNLTNRSSLNKLTNQTVTSAYVYDTYGNVSKETVNYGSGITAVTDQTYYNSASGSLYLIGQPVTKTVTNTRGGSSWIDKETLSYNTIRLPISKITYTGTGGNQKTGETKWEYDANGNVTSEKSAPYNVTEFLGNTYTYDPSGRYVASVTNALLQTTAYSNYDKYGNAKTVKDHKNRTTTRNYDEWGRLVSVAYPDGTTETTDIDWGGEGLYTATHTATGSPAAVTHYDALGREVRTGHQRFDGQWQYVDKAYDSKGRLEKVSLPFKGSSPSAWNTYSYDDNERPSLPTKLTEASGRIITWSYSGLNTTETKNGIATTKTVDASGALVRVSDPGGAITYTLRPDGQPSSITAPGNVITSFGYDIYGRQTSIADPSAGTQTFNDVYTVAGVLTRTVKDANNKTVVSEYDKYGRIKKVTRPEFNTDYAYNTDGLLTSEISTNGTRIDYVKYDGFDRIEIVKETVPDSKWLQRKYTYSGGNVEKVEYASQNEVIISEHFTYNYGHNTEIKLNGTTSIWKLTEENVLGQPTKATTGALERRYGYTPYGMPEYRKVYKTQADTLQSFTYKFGVAKGNLDTRKDNKRNITETFGYDHLNRLTNAAGKAIAYSDNGNITSITGVGTMEYTPSNKPYQVSLITPTGDAVPAREQSLTYTSFQRPATLAENGYNTTFTYNSAGDRVKMLLKQGSTDILTRYYISGQYEIDKEGNIERLYLGGDAYSAPAVYVKEAGNWKIYYICRDYLGSITHVANADGSLKAEYSYDAWGRLRNPATQVAYVPGSEPTLFLGRGYTGHEHLPWFGLINMNARLYDAALGRFLAPDPYIQNPLYSQNYNRYSYALNNPLVYIDQDGESLLLLIGGAILGAYLGGIASNKGELNPLQWNYKDPMTYLGMGFGAILGYTAAYGFLNPGTIGYTLGVNNAWGTASVTLGGAGLGSDWSFQWTTAAGGGGQISNQDYSYQTTKKAVDKSIENAKQSWDFSAYAYASTSLVLLADDVTGIGVVDDILIPVAYAGATFKFAYDNRYLIEKQAREITQWTQKNLSLKQGFVYELQARSSGYYPDVRGGVRYLNQGDVWKYGETTRGTDRYSEDYLNKIGVDIFPIYYGNQIEIKIQEKIMIYGYYFEHGQLPAGNKIFR